MSSLSEILDCCNQFKPKRPTDERDLLQCPDCGVASPLSEWTAYDGLSDGYYCEECNDWHCCIQCPNEECGEMNGAPGTYSPVTVIPYIEESKESGNG